MHLVVNLRLGIIKSRDSWKAVQHDTQRLTTTFLNTYRHKDGHGWRWLGGDIKGERTQSNRRMMVAMEGRKCRRERLFSNNPWGRNIERLELSRFPLSISAEAFVRIDKMRYTPRFISSVLRLLSPSYVISRIDIIQICNSIIAHET